MFNRKLLAVLLAALMVVAVFAGCSKEEATTTTTTAAESGTTTAADPNAEKYGGTLMVYASGDLETINMLSGADNIAFMMSTQIVNMPLVIEDNRSETGYSAGVCESWESDPEKIEWTLHLRKDVTWHDGEPFTADDIIFGQNYYGDENIAFGWIHLDEFPAKWEKIDDYTVKVTHEEPNPNFLSYLYAFYWLIPEHYFADVPAAEFDTCEKGQHPLGNGPFKFVEYEQGENITFEAYEEFYDRAYCDNLIIRIIPDDAAAAVALKSGDIHTLAISALDIEDYLNDDAFYVDIRERASVDLLQLNLNDPIMSDNNIRKAIEHCMRRDVINEQVMGGYGVIGQSPFAAVVQGYTEDLPIYEYSIEKAKEYIEKSGYTMGKDGFYQKDGKTLTIEYAYTGDDQAQKVGLILQQECINAGIDLQVKSYERSVWTPIYEEGTWQICHGGYGLGVTAASISTHYGDCNPYYPDAEVIQGWFSDMAKTNDVNEIVELAEKIQYKIREDSYEIPYNYRVNLTAIRSEVHIDEACDETGILLYHKIWLEK